ncbi:hypothetical protein SeLEV6574_g00606 [Synchytrium endobioticum]|nr:hypothetical protein SeLEV6574_g00606 [Synchytrium endobioticum]
MSKIHIVILIVVFLVLHIQAADDNEIQSHLCQNLIKWRDTAAKWTKKAQDDKTCLTEMDIRHIGQTLKRRQTYVPMFSPTSLDQLAQDPNPRSSREHLTYVMMYNAYQYEWCKTLCVKIFNTLRADGPRVFSSRRGKCLLTHYRKFAGLMKLYSSLENKYATALAAPHLQTVSTTQDTTAHEMSRSLTHLSHTMIVLRGIVAERTKKTRDGKHCLKKDQVMGLSQSLKSRRAYVPKYSSLSLDQLSQDPNPRSSREHLTYVMEYNAYQYENCEVLYLKIANTLGAAGPTLPKRSSDCLLRHFRTLASLTKRYLLLEIKYAIFLGVMAPHHQTVLTAHDEKGHGNEREAAINELRDERLHLANLIDSIKVNKMSVSLDDATDDSVLRLKYSPRSQEELHMDPTSYMSFARLHYVMEYNALMLEKFRFKYAQLTKVLDYVPMGPELRQDLENKQKQIHVMMEIYLGIAYKYANKLVETVVHARFGFKEVPPPSSPVGNGSCNSKEHVPVASSKLGEPEGPNELGFEVDLDPEDWNAVLQLLEETDKSSVSSLPRQAHSSLVDNQASTGPHHFEPYEQDLDVDLDSTLVVHPLDERDEWDAGLEDITEIPPMAREAETAGYFQPLVYQEYLLLEDYQALTEPHYFDPCLPIRQGAVYETAPYGGVGFEQARPPSSDFVDATLVGNEVDTSNQNVPVASSESVKSKYPYELGFEVDLDPEDWNAVLQLLEESEKSSVSSPSCQAHSSQVDNQESIGSHYLEPRPSIRHERDCNQAAVYGSAIGVEAYGSEENPQHLDLWLSQLEAEVTRSASAHPSIADADEAGCSRKRPFCTDDQPLGEPEAEKRRRLGGPYHAEYDSAAERVLERNDAEIMRNGHVRESASQFSVARSGTYAALQYPYMVCNE